MKQGRSVDTLIHDGGLLRRSSSSNNNEKDDIDLEALTKEIEQKFSSAGFPDLKVKFKDMIITSELNVLKPTHRILAKLLMEEIMRKKERKHALETKSGCGSKHPIKLLHHRIFLFQSIPIQNGNIILKMFVNCVLFARTIHI